MTKAVIVYRGIKGGVLPPAFWTPNQFGVMGGIEYSFMSCARSKEVE